MLIVWGTRVIRENRGYLPAFCPICRQLCVCRLVHISTQGHLYYVIPTSRKKLVGAEIQCQSCRVRLPGDGFVHAATCHERPTNVDALIERTRCDPRTAQAERLALEQRVQTGRISAAERRALLPEAFAVVEPLVRERAASVHLDLPAGLTLLTTACGLLALLVMDYGDGEKWSPWPPGWLPLGFGAVAGVFTFYMLFTDVRRFVRRRVEPLLLRALGPLRPTAADLEETLAQLKSARLKVARHTTAQRLADRLSSLG
jgi:hypothetical protein